MNAYFNSSTWTMRAAQKLLPILIQCAKQARTVYYSEIKELLFTQGIPYAVDVQYGRPAGVVGDVLIQLAHDQNSPLYPPLNALVINKATNLPGEGVNSYLARYLGGKTISETRRPICVTKVQQDIFAYKHWDNVLKLMRCPSVEPLNLDTNDDLPAFPRSQNHRGGEGPEHKRMKDYVAANPQVVGLSKDYSPGITERKFACADRVDVFFFHDKHPVAVECKTANASNDELTSGIFQCVKYTALLKAENVLLNSKNTPQSLLAVGRVLPNGHQRLANKLGVTWCLVVYDNAFK